MEVLNKPLWGLKDIQNYFGCSQPTASKIMQKAKQLGVSRMMPSKAKIENVFKAMDMDLNEVRKGYNKMIIRVLFMGRVKDIEAETITVAEMEAYRLADKNFKVLEIIRKG